jgi:hypothetical protein
MPASHRVWDARPFTPRPKFFTVSSSTDFPLQAMLKTNTPTSDASICLNDSRDFVWYNCISRSLTSLVRLSHSSLLHMRISPGDGHQIPGVGVVFDHIEARVPALCILNCSPSVHGILNATVQVCCSGSPLCHFLEGAKKTVVGPYVLIGSNELWVVLLYQAKEVV